MYIICIPINMYIDKYISPYTLCNITSLFLFLIVDIIYIFSLYFPIGFVKNIIFMLLVYALSFFGGIVNLSGTTIGSRFK